MTTRTAWGLALSTRTTDGTVLDAWFPRPALGTPPETTEVEYTTFAAEAASLEAELVRARKDFERSQMLYNNGAISASRLDAAKSAYETRSAQVKSAKQQQNLVEEGPRREDIKAAELRVQQVTALVANAEEKLADTRLYAPITGIVFRKNVELGEIVQPGAAIFVVGDLERPWVKVYVKEDKLSLVKLGQRARITVDTYKDRYYEGTVTFISSDAEFTPKNVQTQEERVKLVFGVKITVTNRDQELKPGMPADVRIFLR